MPDNTLEKLRLLYTEEGLKRINAEIKAVIASLNKSAEEMSALGARAVATLFVPGGDHNV